jgi:hypothetical protein
MYKSTVVRDGEAGKPVAPFVGIAQLDRASDYESEGWRFESSYPRQFMGA